jgi:UDP-glucuronate 4-epimerase
LDSCLEEAFAPAADDVGATYADIEELKRDVGFEPKTVLATGITRCAEWYRMYMQA